MSLEQAKIDLLRQGQWFDVIDQNSMTPQDRGEAQRNWCGEARDAKTRQKAETPP